MIPATYRALLRDPRTRRLLAGLGVSSLGDGMSTVTIAWLAVRVAPSDGDGNDTANGGAGSDTCLVDISPDPDVWTACESVPSLRRFSAFQQFWPGSLISPRRGRSYGFS
jgi:hypothetical protein